MSFLLSSGLRSTIPDSGLVHNYDWSDDATTTSTVPDLAGSTDLTGTFTDLSATINGNQAGTFDGTDDLIDGDYPDLSLPYDIYVVFEYITASTSSYLFDGFTSGQHQFYIDGSGNWNVFNGSGGASDGAADTNAHILTTQWASNTDIARLDQTEIINADTGNRSSDGLTVGDAGGAEGVNSHVKVGQIIVYDPSASGYSVSDVESYLINRWGPF